MARLSYDQRLRNVAVVCLVAFALGLAGFFAKVSYEISQREEAGQSAPYDISVFWAAGKLAFDGTPVLAFDVDKLTEARSLSPQDLEISRRMAWSYPPHFHALVLPLGALPFLAAWIAFTLAGIGVFWWGLRRLVPETSAAIIAWASPAALGCAFLGQNTLIVAGLLAAYLAAVRDSRQGLAGFLLGWLTIKPQFGVLLPIALIVSRNLAVIAWATVTAVAIFLATLAWVGLEYWAAFIDSISASADRMAAGWLPTNLMINWFAFGIATGLPKSLAHGMQLAASAAAVLAVVWVWRRPDTPFRQKATLLTLAMPLASPYVYYYDLAIPMIGAALLMADLRSRDYRGVAAIVLLWVMPMAGHLGRVFGEDYTFGFIGAPVLTVALTLVLWRIATDESSARLLDEALELPAAPRP